MKAVTVILMLVQARGRVFRVIIRVVGTTVRYLSLNDAAAIQCCRWGKRIEGASR
jgi:hypothetical protein